MTEEGVELWWLPLGAGGRSVRRNGRVGTGPVGLGWPGRSRRFRYEVRCWRGGALPDEAEALGGPRPATADPVLVLDVVRTVPFPPGDATTWVPTAPARTAAAPRTGTTRITGGGRTAAGPGSRRTRPGQR